MLTQGAGSVHQRRFSLRTAPEDPHDVLVDLTTIWGNPDAVIAAVRDALATAGIDPADFLEAAWPAADDDELLITCRVGFTCRSSGGVCRAAGPRVDLAVLRVRGVLAQGSPGQRPAGRLELSRGSLAVDVTESAGVCPDDGFA